MSELVGYGGRKMEFAGQLMDDITLRISPELESFLSARDLGKAIEVVLNKKAVYEDNNYALACSEYSAITYYIMDSIDTERPLDPSYNNRSLPQIMEMMTDGVLVLHPHIPPDEKSGVDAYWGKRGLHLVLSMTVDDKQLSVFHQEYYPVTCIVFQDFYLQFASQTHGKYGEAAIEQKAYLQKIITSVDVIKTNSVEKYAKWQRGIGFDWSTYEQDYQSYREAVNRQSSTRKSSTKPQEKKEGAGCPLAVLTMASFLFLIMYSIFSLI